MLDEFASFDWGELDLNDGGLEMWGDGRIGSLAA